MTIAELREIHQARPFQRFRLQLADGRQVDVPHPEFMWFHPRNSRMVIVALPNGAFKLIDLLLVASVEFGNGRGGRPKS